MAVIDVSMWRKWDSDVFPACEFKWASLVVSKQDEFKPVSMTIWGIFRSNKEDERNIVLMKSFQKEDRNWGLSSWLSEQLKKYNADALLIAENSRGCTLIDDLNRSRTFMDDEFPCRIKGVEVFNATELLSGIQPIFDLGRVYSPNREWACSVMDQVATFPSGRYRNLAVSTAIAIDYALNVGLVCGSAASPILETV